MTRDERTALLDELAVTANIVFACRAGGVTREEALAERDSDEAFRDLWREAVRLADARARQRQQEGAPGSARRAATVIAGADAMIAAVAEERGAT